ncbi:COG5646 Uncharacterized conserved protein [actinobacterium SCGC AAA044-D11]
MKKIPRAVASYYASAPSTHKKTLLEMRTRILEVVPLADEIIKYAMPTFVVEGVEVAGLLFHKNHIGYYPYSGSILNKFPEICAKYKTSKGALQMPIEKPLLKGEVKKLIKARLALAK